MVKMSKTIPNEINGAAMALFAFEEENITKIFGYPGGAILPFYDALHLDENIVHILTRHEQAAGHAAEGYAKSTGKLGVAITTSGPGATNIITPIADAGMDSTPLLVLTGQVGSASLGLQAFQETDVIGVTSPLTKASFQVTKAEDIYLTVRKAIYIAQEGRQGPVVVDITKDAQQNLVIEGTQEELQHYASKIRREFSDWKHEQESKLNKKLDKPAKLTEAPPSWYVKEVAQDIMRAKKPIFYIGGGMTASSKESQQQLRALAKRLNVPVTATLLGLSVFEMKEESHYLGMLGMYGRYEANMAMHGADLIVALGARFDDRITGNVKGFAPTAKIVHVDIDPTVLNRNIKADRAILADVGPYLTFLNEVLQAQQELDIAPWRAQIQQWKDRDGFQLPPKEGVMHPSHVVKALEKHIKGDPNVYVVTDVGNNQMFTAQHFGFNPKRKGIFSGGLGTMGFSLPAALGVQVADPQGLVICINGDGGFMMNVQELSTIVAEKLPVKILIFNNNVLGMVTQWQDLLHESRYSHTEFESTHPDFVKLVEAFGIPAQRISEYNELDDAVKKLYETDGPAFLEVMVDEKAMVLPMILPGRNHNEMIFEI